MVMRLRAHLRPRDPRDHRGVEVLVELRLAHLAMIAGTQALPSGQSLRALPLVVRARFDILDLTGTFVTLHTCTVSAARPLVQPRPAPARNPRDRRMRSALDSASR